MLIINPNFLCPVYKCWRVIGKVNRSCLFIIWKKTILGTNPKIGQNRKNLQKHMINIWSAFENEQEVQAERDEGTSESYICFKSIIYLHYFGL